MSCREQRVRLRGGSDRKSDEVVFCKRLATTKSLLQGQSTIGTFARRFADDETRRDETRDGALTLEIRDAFRSHITPIYNNNYLSIST